MLFYFNFFKVFLIYPIISYILPFQKTFRQIFIRKVYRRYFYKMSFIHISHDTAWSAAYFHIISNLAPIYILIYQIRKIKDDLISILVFPIFIPISFFTISMHWLTSRSLCFFLFKHPYELEAIYSKKQ